MYADYEFYKNTYFGSALAESEFYPYEDRASDMLDYFTFDQARECTDEDIKKKVSKAACRLAELLKESDEARVALGYVKCSDGTMRGQIVSSMSAGNESINYSTSSGQSAIMKAMQTGPDAIERIYFDEVRKYLAGTGLLYAGWN